MARSVVNANSSVGYRSGRHSHQSLLAKWGRIQNLPDVRSIVTHPFPSQTYQCLQYIDLAVYERGGSACTVRGWHKPIYLAVRCIWMRPGQSEQNAHALVFFFTVEVELPRE